MIQITPEIAIEENEIQLEFVRSSGPGGQNVNKVSTAVQLRFNAAGSPSLPIEVRQRLLKQAKGRINHEGILVIAAQRFRTQGANREDAVDRLVNLIRKAAEKPRPRFKTKPTLASKKRRLETKRRRSQTKQLRSGKPEGDED
jgi:ribosome-associated protein